MTDNTLAHPFDASLVGWALETYFPLPQWVQDPGPWKFDRDHAHRQCEKVFGRWEIVNSLGRIEGHSAVALELNDFYDFPGVSGEPEMSRFESITIQIPPGCEEITPSQARAIARALLEAADVMEDGE